MAGTGPLFVQVGPPKIAISRGFTTFFKTTGLQLKLLVLIESPNMFHGKSAKKQSGCGHGEKFEPNYRLHHMKNRCATIACLATKFEGYRRVKSRTPPTK